MLPGIRWSPQCKCQSSPGRQQLAALAAHCSLRCHLHRLQGHGRCRHSFSDAEEVVCSTVVTAISLSTCLTFGKGKVVLSKNNELLSASTEREVKKPGPCIAYLHCASCRRGRVRTALASARDTGASSPTTDDFDFGNICPVCFVGRS